MMTLQQHLDLLAHALGDTPDSRHSLLETLNRAGKRVYAAHQWPWRIRGPVLVPLVENQPYIELPVNFKAHRSWYIDNAAAQAAPSTIRVTTAEQIAKLREQQGVTSSACWHIAPGPWSGQPDGPADQPPRPRWLVWPTPGADAPNLSLIYVAGWTDLRSGDTAAVPDVPADCETLLIYAARAEAKVIENESLVQPDIALYEGRFREELARLIGEYGIDDAAPERITGGPASACMSDEALDPVRFTPVVFE